MAPVGTVAQSPPRLGGLGFLKIPSSQTGSMSMSLKSPTLSTPSSSPREARPLRACASYNGRSTTTTFGSSSTEVEDLSNLFISNKNYYDLLGVNVSSSQNEIRSAYRQMALRYHPDVVPIQQLDVATKIFSEINQAYDTLSNPEKKKTYDRQTLTPKLYKSRSSSSGSSFRFWRSKNWETDQCWC